MELEIKTNVFGFRQETKIKNLPVFFKAALKKLISLFIIETSIEVHFNIIIGDTLFCLSSETTWLENDSLLEQFVSRL